MNSYSLIRNENEIIRFMENVLLPLKDDEVYITVLTARKKYCNSINSSLEVVARDIIRSNDTQKVMRKLRKISIVEGLYTDKDENIIPIDAFALYILPEQRSMVKAYKEFNRDINEWIYESLKGESKNLEFYRRLDVKLFSAIHKSKSRSNYFIVDIDRKDESLLKEVVDCIIDNHAEYDDIRWISETRGGYHVIINRNKITGLAVHKLVEKNLQDVEFRKESMTPVPGTLQGGFIVKRFDEVI